MARAIGAISRPDLEPDPPPLVPHLLGRLHIVCFLSLAGGVGKTTLAVEAAVAGRLAHQVPNARW